MPHNDHSGVTSLCKQKPTVGLYKLFFHEAFESVCPMGKFSKFLWEISVTMTANISSPIISYLNPSSSW